MPNAKTQVLRCVATQVAARSGARLGAGGCASSCTGWPTGLPRRQRFGPAGGGRYRPAPVLILTAAPRGAAANLTVQHICYGHSRCCSGLLCRPCCYPRRQTLWRRQTSRRRFLASGGFHYPRASPGSWRAIMRAMKANGLNTITTYAFWELHERRRGVYDWGQIRPEANVSAWLALAHEEGLWVHMRIGPYINGNWQAGGFPAWLREIPSIEYRTDNEPFKKEMQRWFDDFVEHVRPWLHAGDTGGPIISVQVENEYSYSSTADMRYIDWCEQRLFAAIL